VGGVWVVVSGVWVVVGGVWVVVNGVWVVVGGVMGRGISFKCNMLADGKYACLWVVCLHKGWYMGGTDMHLLCQIAKILLTQSIYHIV
jgi:hypothetical protein